MPDQSTLGELLRAKRDELGIGEKVAGRLVGISGPWLRSIEAGSQPSVKVCWMLADAYDLDPREVLRLAGRPEDSPRPMPPPQRRAEVMSPIDGDMILDSILKDERLAPELRMHLAHEYQLLLRLQAAQPVERTPDEVDRDLLGELDKAPSAAERLRKPPQK